MAESRLTFELSAGTAALQAHHDTWDALAALYPNPFLSATWLAAWARARPQDLVCATLVDDQGVLVAAAALREIAGGYASAGDADWDVVAVDQVTRRRMWDEVVGLAPRRFHLGHLRVGTPEMDLATEVLGRAGYGVQTSVREESCPYVDLPASFEELLASRSRNARQQFRSKSRQLQRAGTVRFRRTTGGPDLQPDFEEFLRLEASGWKGREGTAILNRPTRECGYRAFVSEAAERGWLRLHLLELDGAVIAAILLTVLGDEAFYLKSGFDERRSDLSPGFVLMGEVMRSAIDEGARGLDMLGRADAYKMRWTDTLRPRVRLRAYRGPVGRVGQQAWGAAVRPGLVALRDRARRDARLCSVLERAQRIFER